MNDTDLPSIEEVHEYLRDQEKFKIPNAKAIARQKMYFQQQKERFKIQRDHTGEIMTKMNMKLAKKGMWSRGNFMKPVVLSPSVNVEKDALKNLRKRMRDEKSIDVNKTN